MVVRTKRKTDVFFLVDTINRCIKASLIRET